jgi:predicted thioredoxin/glutaredoxin
MNCVTLAKRTEIAVKEMDLEAEIVKVTDYQVIAAHGILKTPALMIDEKLVFTGKVPTLQELKEYIKGAQN